MLLFSCSVVAASLTVNLNGIYNIVISGLNVLLTSSIIKELSIVNEANVKTCRCVPDGAKLTWEDRKLLAQLNEVMPDNVRFNWQSTYSTIL